MNPTELREKLEQIANDVRDVARWYMARTQDDPRTIVQTIRMIALDFIDAANIEIKQKITPRVLMETNTRRIRFQVSAEKRFKTDNLRTAVVCIDQEK